ncbi:MAG TPA: ABC transporter ATP-binding protein [Solirubrobacteraceae bacterium]|nr:ABC transporter ATP-binding protein [Solirubrobacteraceae bacterium]
MSANGLSPTGSDVEPLGGGGGAASVGAPLLEISGLRIDFHQAGNVVRAVDGLTYAVPRARTVGLIGESGCGKTVSSRAIMGLLPPSALITGSIRFEGQELVGLPERRLRELRGSQIAMVFQDPARSLNPTLRIGPQITEAIRLHSDVTKTAAHDRAVELMELVRLPAARQRFRQYPHQLSGGMRQRVMIAIALAAEPKLLIADEATTALDVTTQAQIMELLRDLQQRLGMALIMISHDLGLAASFADEVMVMYAGRGVERAPTRKLFEHVRMPYTRALLDAIPRLENASHSPLAAVAGQPPDLAHEQVGCPFSPRCPNATEKCREHAPPFQEQEPDHLWACWHPCGLERPA